MRIFTLLILTILGCLLSCSNSPEKPIVIYVNSYHHGHPSSDEIQEVIVEQFSPDSFDLNSFFMDTKRNPDEDYILEKAAFLFDTISELQPDILIVSDDNAVKYLVKPHLDHFDFPIVFCGVNVSADKYELPPEKVTGMLEILPLEEVLIALKEYDPGISSVLVLNENTNTARKEKELLDGLYQRLDLKVNYELVDDFDQWKEAFLKANRENDIIYVLTHGAIRNWKHDEAAAFVRENIKVPVFTCEDFMMPYAVFGITKIAAEQGEWASATAKALLSGKKPLDFPLVSNKASRKYLNEGLAEIISFDYSAEDLNRITPGKSEQ